MGVDQMGSNNLTPDELNFLRWQLTDLQSRIKVERDPATKANLQKELDDRLNNFRKIVSGDNK